MESWVVVSLLESREVNVFSLFKKLMTTIMQLACRHVHTSTDLDRPLWTSKRHAYYRTVSFSNVALHKQLIIHCIHTQLSMFQTHSCLFLVVFVKKIVWCLHFLPNHHFERSHDFCWEFRARCKTYPDLSVPMIFIVTMSISKAAIFLYYIGLYVLLLYLSIGTVY